MPFLPPNQQRQSTEGKKENYRGRYTKEKKEGIGIQPQMGSADLPGKWMKN